MFRCLETTSKTQWCLYCCQHDLVIAYLIHNHCFIVGNTITSNGMTLSICMQVQSRSFFIYILHLLKANRGKIDDAVIQQKLQQLERPCNIPLTYFWVMNGKVRHQFVVRPCRTPTSQSHTLVPLGLRMPWTTLMIRSCLCDMYAVYCALFPFGHIESLDINLNHLPIFVRVVLLFTGVILWFPNASEVTLTNVGNIDWLIIFVLSFPTSEKRIFRNVQN